MCSASSIPLLIALLVLWLSLGALEDFGAVVVEVPVVPGVVVAGVEVVLAVLGVVAVELVLPVAVLPGVVVAGGVVAAV